MQNESMITSFSSFFHICCAIVNWLTQSFFEGMQLPRRKTGPQESCSSQLSWRLHLALSPGCSRDSLQWSSCPLLGPHLHWQHRGLFQLENYCTEPLKISTGFWTPFSFMYATAFSIAYWVWSSTPIASNYIMNEPNTWPLKVLKCWNTQTPLLYLIVVPDDLSRD